MIITLFILLSASLALQSVRLYRTARGVRMPTPQSRQVSEFGIYNWITVTDLSQKFNLSEEIIFELLGIAPLPGDNKLSLRDLRLKYNKTPEEMKQGISKILETGKRSGAPNNIPGAVPNARSRGITKGGTHE